MQSCAVDPGAVRSNIWKRAGPLLQFISNNLFAPNEDGCQAVVYAACDKWQPVTQQPSSKQKAVLRVSTALKG